MACLGRDGLQKNSGRRGRGQVFWGSRGSRELPQLMPCAGRCWAPMRGMGMSLTSQTSLTIFFPVFPLLQRPQYWRSVASEPEPCWPPQPCHSHRHCSCASSPATSVTCARAATAAASHPGSSGSSLGSCFCALQQPGELPCHAWDRTGQRRVPRLTQPSWLCCMTAQQCPRHRVFQRGRPDLEAAIPAVMLRYDTRSQSDQA